MLQCVIMRVPLVTHSLAIAVSTVLLAAAGTPASAATAESDAPAAETEAETPAPGAKTPFTRILAALPAAGRDALRIQGGVFVKDLRASSGYWQDAMARLRRLRLGRRYLAADSEAFSGPELVTLLDTLVDVAAPQQLPIPVALVAYVREGQIGVQAMLKTEPGVLERLASTDWAAAATAGPAETNENGPAKTNENGPAKTNKSSRTRKSEAGGEPASTARLATNPEAQHGAQPADRPPVSVDVEGNRALVRLATTTLYARRDAAGWLRVAPSPKMLAGPGAQSPPPPELFGPRLAAQLRGMHGVAFVQGQSLLGRLLQQQLPFENTNGVLKRVRTVAAAWRGTSDSRTVELKLLAESGLIAKLGNSVRGAGDVSGAMRALWGRDATSLLSVAVANGFIRSGLQAAAEHWSQAPRAPPPELVSALSKLQGSIDLVGFDAPGDWAVGLRFRNAEQAAGVVPQLRAWIQSAAPAFSPANARSGPDTSQADGPLRLTADPALPGLRVGAIGKTVVVARHAGRFSAVAERHAARRERPPSQLRMFAGPLTPQMRDIVNTPGLLTAYTVYGGTGRWSDWLVWPAKLAGQYGERLLEQMQNQDGMAGWAATLGTALLARLPLSVAFGGAQSLLLYDLAASAQLDGNVLVLRLGFSEL